MTDSWTEIRCPACVYLGWESSRLLLKIEGKTVPMSNVSIEIKCQRCKSMVVWKFGTPILYASQMGERNHKRQKLAFE